MVLLIMVTAPEVVLIAPPPRLEELSVIELFVTKTEPSDVLIPPPNSTAAELSLIVLLVMVTEPEARLDTAAVVAS